MPVEPVQLITKAAIMGGAFLFCYALVWAPLDRIQASKEGRPAPSPRPPLLLGLTALVIAGTGFVAQWIAPG